MTAEPCIFCGEPTTDRCERCSDRHPACVDKAACEQRRIKRERRIRAERKDQK